VEIRSEIIFKSDMEEEGWWKQTGSHCQNLKAAYIQCQEARILGHRYIFQVRLSHRHLICDLCWLG